jgi:hypothetical protein
VVGVVPELGAVVEVVEVGVVTVVWVPPPVGREVVGVETLVVVVVAGGGVVVVVVVVETAGTNTAPPVDPRVAAGAGGLK